MGFETKTIRIAMNGITGRMGYRQHLLRSILPIRDAGGFTLEDGTRVQVEPILVGRNEAKIRELAELHKVSEWTTDLDAVINDPTVDIVFDASMTSLRAATLKKAMRAGKHIFTEKPTAETLEEAIELARIGKEAGVTAGVVHDKLYLPGLVKLRRLVDEGFFGRILSIRGEFGYWVFEGDVQAAQRPSWNYRKEDGGGMTTDMFCHWNYVLEGIIGKVKSVNAKTATHIPARWDEAGKEYKATADDASYGIFELETPGGDDVIGQINSSWAVRVYRDELVEFQIDGTHGSAVAGLNKCVAQQRAHTPKPVWNPDLPVTESFREPVAGSPRQRRTGQRLQAAVGRIPARRRRRPRTPLRPALRSPRRAAGRARPAVLGRAPHHRHPGDHALMTSLILPTDDGGTREYRLQGSHLWAKPTAPLTARRAYAAAHVIPEVAADNTPGAPARLDWDATLAYRHELWSYGLGVADAMDTAQRGMGLDWAATQQLIKRTGVEAASVVAAGNAATAGKSVRDLVSCGAGTDQLDIATLPDGRGRPPGRHRRLPRADRRRQRSRPQGHPDGLPRPGQGRQRRRRLPARLLHAAAGS